VFDDGFPLPALSDNAWVYITIIDNVPPTIICQDDFSVNVSTNTCAGLVVLTPPVVSDNCDVVVLTGPFTSPINGLISGGQWPVGVHTVTYNAVDAVGNTATCSHTVTVIDDIFPVIVGCPANITVNNATGLCGAFVIWTLPSALDNCGVISFTSNFQSGDFFPVGTTTVTYIAEDAAGNSVSCSFTVTVIDNTAPVIFNCPSNIVVSNDAGECEAIVDFVPPFATDNCGVVNVTSTHNPGDVFPIGTTIVTYTFSDNAVPANVAVCEFTVTVVDNEAPIIDECPNEIIVSNDPGACGALVTWTMPFASDNCGVTVTSSHNSGDFFPIGTTTVIITATDAAGNVATCEFFVTVEDTELPTIICPADFVVTVSPSTCAGLVILPAPIVNDNCPNFVVTGPFTAPIAGLISGGQWPVGIYTVSYIITDASGNQNTCSYTVTVNDESAPIIVACPDNITVNNAPGLCGANVSWTVPSALDDCGVVSFTSTHNPGDFFTVGQHIVTYTAEDASGNITICEFTITVIDNEAPVVSDCPTNITVSTDAGLCEAEVSWTVPTATDNCGVVTVDNTHNPGDIFPVGTTVVTYTFTDGANPANVTICTFTVTVIDNEAPVIVDCPTDIVVVNDPGQCGANVTWTAPSATDNCGLTTWTSNFNSGDFFPVGTTVVTYTAVDAQGNVTTCSFTVTVEDVELPTITCPADFEVTVSPSTCAGLVNLPAPIVSDNCPDFVLTGPIISPDLGLISGGQWPVGVYTVSYIVTDASGNQDSCSYTVTVNDESAPIIVACPDNITVNNAPGLCGANVSWTVPSALDDCGVVSFTSTHNPGDFFSVGQHTVIYTAVDASGNVTICQFVITVIDNEAPVVSDCPTNITVSTDAGLCEAEVSWTVPTATDNCGVVTVTNTHNPGDIFPVGTTTVTYTFTDGANPANVTICTFTVTVIDNEAPVIVDCPTDIVVDNDPGQCGANVTWTAPSATDNCGLTTWTSNFNSGDFFPIGTTTVIYTAEDAQGNVTTCSFTVTVEDVEAPVITCPSDTSIVTMINTCWMQVWYDAPVITDNCDASSLTVSYSAPPGSLFNIGDSTVVVTVTDAAGNQTTCSFVVTVIDPQPPVINVCPIDMTINNVTDSCGGFASWIQPTVFDNCDFTLTNTIVFQGNIIAQNVSNINNYLPVGISTVTYIAQDLSGGFATCTFNVTVIDVQAPTFVVAPQDTTIFSVSDDCGAPYTWAEPTVIDNCAVDTVFYASIPAGFENGDVFPVGETTIVYTAIDIYGNSSTHTFVITVIDTIAPIIDNCPTDIVINTVPGECGVFVTWEEVTATDNCGMLEITANINSGTYFFVGVWPIVITATDIYGNSSTCEFTVTVIDAEPPVFESVPGQFFICAVDTADFNIQTQIMDALIVTDNCGVLSVTNGGVNWVIGNNTIVITATDVNGNVSDTTVVVTVYPMPTVTLITDSIEVCNGETLTLVVQDPAPNVQYVWSHSWGTVIGVGPTYEFNPIRPQNSGTYVVTATNEFGCSVSTEIVIEVKDCSIVIPEFFSPGGDGINDFFVIENLEAYPGTKVLIFNRWGSQVYQSDDYLNYWDGTSDSRFNVGGDQLPEGTYFYVLTLGGQPNDATFGKVYTGYIYLKR